jgi:tRNA 2-thiouridine synthesizing protein A
MKSPNNSSEAFGGRPKVVDVVLSAEGLFCPIPIARATERMAAMGAGEVLEIRATDPGVIIDIPAWCHSASLEFLGYERTADVIVSWVRRPKPGG